MTHETTDPAAVFAHRAARFTAVLDGVPAAGGWDAPTPCEGWRVRDVVEHVVATERDFLGRHDLAPALDPALDPDAPEAADADPALLWRAHADAVTTALAADGVADRGFDGYFGPTTVGATMADFYGWDLAVHAWDVAAATGQPSPLDDAEARRLSVIADAWGDALHSEGICAAPLPPPEDASDADRLLARLGRDPRWGPGSGA